MGVDGRGERKRKNPGLEYYDLMDQLIDDSELAVDKHTFIAQTKQPEQLEEIYACSCEIALLKEKSHRKPKSNKFALPAQARAHRGTNAIFVQNICGLMSKARGFVPLMPLDNYSPFVAPKDYPGKAVLAV